MNATVPVSQRLQASKQVLDQYVAIEDELTELLEVCEASVTAGTEIPWAAKLAYKEIGGKLREILEKKR